MLGIRLIPAEFQLNQFVPYSALSLLQPPPLTLFGSLGLMSSVPTVSSFCRMIDEAGGSRLLARVNGD